MSLSSASNTFSFCLFFVKKIFKNFGILKDYGHIWNQHGKYIKMSTNMPQFGPVVLEIPGSIFPNKTSLSIKTCTQAYSTSNFEIRRQIAYFRRVTIKSACSIWNRGKTHVLYGYSSEICNLLCVTSRLISKLGREQH